MCCNVHAHQIQFSHEIGMEFISNTSFTTIKKSIYQLKYYMSYNCFNLSVD